MGLEVKGKQSKERSFSSQSPSKNVTDTKPKTKPSPLTKIPTALKKPLDEGIQGHSPWFAFLRAFFAESQRMRKNVSSLRYKNKAKKGYTYPA